ncbi:MAG: hypothetical protein RHS_2249 [Robinsoniella sp. RHS]|nr:MAG: hypothetical protein RHS_2249 [Robinsoniella sp. RHS]
MFMYLKNDASCCTTYNSNFKTRSGTKEKTYPQMESLQISLVI